MAGELFCVTSISCLLYFSSISLPFLSLEDLNAVNFPCSTSGPGEMFALK